MSSGMAGTIDSAAQDRFARARALEEDGLVEQAEALYRQLLSAHPAHPILLARLALVLKSRGAFGEAERLLRRAIMGSPNEAALHNNLGNVLRNLDRFPDARLCYSKAIALDPSYGEAQYNLGVVLEDMDLPDEALAAYRRAVELQTDYAAARVRIAAVLRSLDKLSEALAELDAVLSLQPDSFEARYYRGLTLARLERFDDAAGDLEHAVALKPDSHDALLALANNLKGAGRHDEALTALWRVVELQPMQAEVHDDLNRLAWMAGRKDMFLKSFAYVRERHGDDPALLFSEAQLRVQRNDANGAEPLLRRALEIAPEHGATNALLGRMLARRGRFDESFAAFAMAARVEPNVTAYRNEFGYALMQGREHTQALAQFETARGINAADQLALAGICLAYRALGDSRYHELVNVDQFVRSYPLRLPRGYADVRAYNDALAEELAKLHTTTSEPLDQTLRGGTQTGGLLFARKSKMIEEIRDAIAEAVADYVAAMPAHADHPLLSRKEEEFGFTHSWSCKLRSSGFHTNHVHPMGWISSAYYVSVPDALEDEIARPGWLTFGQSHLDLGGDDRPEHFVQPAVGRLVLFPSYFWHGTVPFESPSDRLTIAFDVVPGQVDPSTLATGPY
jgi:tetratricopeptide (TPR) repeat protein